jgi:iron complex transport system substrate-binding protein
MKIISLLPGATETLCLLGLSDQLVGISHACDFPKAIQHLPRITSPNLQLGKSSEIDSQVAEASKAGSPLYSLDAKAIQNLAPDLIITQDLCEVCAVSPTDLQGITTQLARPPEILNLTAETLDQVLNEILLIGRATNKAQAAERLQQSLADRLQSIKDRIDDQRPQPTVVLLEWLDPPYSAGHWTPSLIQIAGGCDLLGHPNQKSRRVSWEAIYQAQPDKLIIACCGYDLPRMMSEFSDDALQQKLRPLTCVQREQLYLIDGSAYLNRPGPRLIDAAEILLNILHPEMEIATASKHGWSKISLNTLDLSDPLT